MISLSPTVLPNCKRVPSGTLVLAIYIFLAPGTVVCTSYTEHLRLFRSYRIYSQHNHTHTHTRPFTRVHTHTRSHARTPIHTHTQQRQLVNHILTANAIVTTHITLLRLIPPCCVPHPVHECDGCCLVVCHPSSAMVASVSAAGVDVALRA